MNAPTPPAALEMPAEFTDCLAAQQAAWHAQRNPTRQQRAADLRALHALVAENQDAFVAAVNRDFGCRSAFETRATELLQVIDACLYAIRHLRRWMRPQRRKLDATQFPLARAWTFPQPVGVVGIVVPWNFPVAMALQPLVCALAAGNRAMVKMSENSQHTAALLERLAPKYFARDKVAFFADGGGRGPAFTRLPFDHLFFTGSPATGRAVMASAAQNLTPVTLELGGKSPAVVAPGYSMKKAAERVLWAKMINAGQVCTTVDYLFVPEGRVDEFLREAQGVATRRYPDLTNGDYTAIIDQRQYQRLQQARQDALDRGARLVNLCGGQPGDASRRLMPLEAVVGATDDMQVLQREIFGPLLPILTYRDHQQVLDYIAARPRPLALYLYSDDRREQQLYLQQTLSGGVGINESLVQASMHDLPFGGTGMSGMGHYHGYEGFLTFSKLRPVFRQGPWRALDLFMPPYRGLPERILGLMTRLKS